MLPSHFTLRIGNFMAKVTIRISRQTGAAYFPKELREDGFVGKIEGLPNAMTLTLIKPGTALPDVECSLRILLKDIALRRKQEENNLKRKDGEDDSAKLQIEHPVFLKYSREWLHQVTGYSLGHLCRIARGRVPLTRYFIERVCLKLGKPEAELFLPDAARASPCPEGSDTGGS